MDKFWRNEYEEQVIPTLRKKGINPYSGDNFSASPESNWMQNKLINQNLKPCPSCGRTFLPKPFEIHTKIWEKVFCRKRKVFNSANQRIIWREQLVLMKKSLAKEQLIRKQEQNRKYKFLVYFFSLYYLTTSFIIHFL